MRVLIGLCLIFSAQVYGYPSCDPAYYDPSLEDFSKKLCQAKASRGIASKRKDWEKALKSSKNQYLIGLAKNKNAKAIDLNANGKDDFFRSFYKDGSTKSVKYDQDEDGFYEYTAKYDRNARLIFQNIDYNGDQKVDEKLRCKGDTCQRSIDANFDGDFEQRRSYKRINSKLKTKYEIRDKNNQFKLIRQGEYSMNEFVPRTSRIDEIEGSVCLPCYTNVRTQEDYWELEDDYVDNLSPILQSWYDTKEYLIPDHSRFRNFERSLGGYHIHESCKNKYGKDFIYEAAWQASLPFLNCLYRLGSGEGQASAMKHLPDLVTMLFSENAPKIVCHDTKTESGQPIKMKDAIELASSNDSNKALSDDPNYPGEVYEHPIILMFQTTDNPMELASTIAHGVMHNLGHRHYYDHHREEKTHEHEFVWGCQIACFQEVEMGTTDDIKREPAELLCNDMGPSNAPEYNARVRTLEEYSGELTEIGRNSRGEPILRGIISGDIY